MEYQVCIFVQFLISLKTAVQRFLERCGLHYVRLLQKRKVFGWPAILLLLNLYTSYLFFPYI